jgi:hypothetical protein
MNLKAGDYIAVGRNNSLSIGVFKKRNPKTISYYPLTSTGLKLFKTDLGLIQGDTYGLPYIEEYRAIKVTYDNIIDHYSTYKSTSTIEMINEFEELLKKYKYK